MALPLSKNLNIYSGDSFSFTTTYVGSEDLSSASSLCQFRQTVDSVDYLVEITGTINVVDNEISFSLTPIQTQALRVSDVGDCGYSQVVYDTQLTFLNGTVNTNQKGVGKIYHDVTRA